MIITLKENTFTPVSLTDLYQVKGHYLKNYTSQFAKIGKALTKTFKQTAFFDFWLVATSNIDN